MSHQVDLSLTPTRARALLPQPAHEIAVELLRPENHTWRITADGTDYYLKAHTKSWYGGRPSPDVVRHEVTAYRLLREAGLPAPEVVNVALDVDNALGWPHLITRGLAGEPLTDLLERLEERQAAQAMRAVGNYLRRMHDLTFEHPGYLIDGPPREEPDPQVWQHWIWRPERLLTYAFVNWAQDAAAVGPETMDVVSGLLAEQLPALCATYRPPRFVHGDCHASQFFLAEADGTWRVTGVVDMEIASAGSPLEDFLKLGIELAGWFRWSGEGSRRWWESLFDGYGEQIDVDLLRLRLLAAAHESYVCHGDRSWPGTRAEIVRHLTAARTWEEVFELERIGTRSGPAGMSRT